ncbi:hypothetical protein ACFX13_023507 [Malus domestica]
MHFPLMRSANLTRRTSNHLHLTDIQKQEALPQLSKPTTLAPTPLSSLESTRSKFGMSAPSSPTRESCWLQEHQSVTKPLSSSAKMMNNAAMTTKDESEYDSSC